MLAKLFGDVTTGELARLPYLGYSILLNIIWILGLLAVVMIIGATESFIGGDLHQAQQLISENLSLPFMLVFIFLTSLIIFGSMNIVAKRIRNIGLPGWKSLIIFVILTAVISVYISEDISSLIGVIFGLLLLFFPGSHSNRNQDTL